MVIAQERDALSVTEARERLGGISNGTIYELIGSGELKSFTVGRRRFISRDAIREFIKRKENQAERDGRTA